MPEQLPLHPWHDSLPDLAEGKGSFYHYGPNYTVDPIVLAERPVPSILLVKRHDNGKWALPGGFIDDDESAPAAGRRELHEETNLVMPDDQQPIVIYQGPVDDHRSTRNAWPETTALLWQIAHTEIVTAGDDADDAAWIPIGELPNGLHGSHRMLADKAIALATCSDAVMSDSLRIAQRQ